jgi:hypothetical protein
MAPMTSRRKGLVPRTPQNDTADLIFLLELIQQLEKLIKQQGRKGVPSFGAIESDPQNLLALFRD